MSAVNESRSVKLATLGPLRGATIVAGIIALGTITLAARAASEPPGTIAFVSTYRADAWAGVVLEAAPGGGTTRRRAGMDVVPSPDGRRLAIVHRAGSRIVLSLSDRAGAAKRTVVGWPAARTAAYAIRWSPDGTSLVVIVGGERASLVDRSGHQTDLGPSRAATWAPDSTRFALFRRRAIEIRRADGQSVRRLAGASALAWSADGSRAAYALERPTRVVVSDARGAQILAVRARQRDTKANVSWSPVGRRLVVEFFGVGFPERWVVESDGRKTTTPYLPHVGWDGTRPISAAPWLERQTSEESLPLAGQLDVSPAGEIVYLGDDSGFFDLASGRRLPGSPKVNRYDAFGWSPDGRSYLIRDQKRRQIVAISMRSFARRAVASLPPDTNLVWARWDPDGQIRLRLRTADFPRLYLLDEATGSSTAVRGIDPDGEPHYGFPVWSPDGRTLLAVRGDGRTTSGRPLVLFETGRSRERRLGLSGLGRPSWSQDGAKIVLVDQGRITLRRVTDGRDELISTVPNATNASLSPDGARLAVTTNRALLVVPIDRPNELSVIVSFAPPRPNVFAPTEPTWSPDGTRIAYRDQTGLYVAAADGKTPPVLLVRQAARPSVPTWTASGAWIIFAASDPACDGQLRLMRISPEGGSASHVHRMPGCGGARAPSWRP